MKIAIYHELPDGGAKSSTLKIGTLLKQKNHEVDLYYLSDVQDELKKYQFNKVSFNKFVPRNWQGKNWKIRIYKDTLELFKLYNLNKQIAKKINQNNYDLVIVNASKYIETPFILRFIKTKKVFYAHDPNYRLVYDKAVGIPKNLNILKFNYEKLNRTIRKILDKQNVSHIDLVLTNSEFAKDIFENTYNKNCVVSYLGVDENLFKPSKAKKVIDILFVGKLDKLDGYSLLEDSLKLIKGNIKVKTIPGNDNWIANEIEMVELYCKSKIVVCLAYNEPFGLVPLEAMACEVPVVAVNEGGYNESVLDKRTGYLINRNKNELANKIRLLLDNPKITNTLGKNARLEIIKKWTWERKINQLEKNLLL